MFKLSKSSRLQSKKEYAQVFSQANKTVVSDLILLHRINDLGHARLGFAVSKKNISRANQRNRIKRIVRESFRTHTLPAVDLVVLAKKGARHLENRTIYSNLELAWEKLTVYYAN